MQFRHVKDLMESEPVMIAPNATLSEAARKMKEVDCGFLPVGTDDTPEGIITDRDIVIRAIADGKDPGRERVRDYMTAEVCACRESDTLEGAAKTMSENNVSRLVVEDDAGHVSGVLTFGRMIRSNDDQEETGNIVVQATRQQRDPMGSFMA